MRILPPALNLHLSSRTGAASLQNTADHHNSAAPTQSWEVSAIAALLLSAARHLAPAVAPAPEMLVKMDSVTGLLSRASFVAEAAPVLAAARAKAAPLSAIMIDVDALKAINDTHGCAAGDAVLAHVARSVVMNIQPGVDLAGRLAGAELILLLPEADFGWASALAERLRGTLANRPLNCDGALIEASASFGVASLIESDVTLESLLSRARCALNLAKNLGRNAVCVAQDQALAAA